MRFASIKHPHLKDKNLYNFEREIVKKERVIKNIPFAAVAFNPSSTRPFAYF